MKTFVQIGVFDGVDDFRQRVKDVKPDRVFLIEPNKDIIPVIEQNYKDIVGMGIQVIIENVAITDGKTSTTSLFLPKSIDNGRAQNGVYYANSNFSILPMDDWGTNLIEIKSECISFNEFCFKWGIYHIDFLMIDTEGFDYIIINSIDFNQVVIKSIQYEKWPFGTNCFKRHGYNELFGEKGMVHTKKFLEDMGYFLTETEMDILAIIKPINNTILDI